MWIKSTDNQLPHEKFRIQSTEISWCRYEDQRAAMHFAYLPIWQAGVYRSTKRTWCKPSCSKVCQNHPEIGPQCQVYRLQSSESRRYRRSSLPDSAGKPQPNAWSILILRAGAFSRAHLSDGEAACGSAHLCEWKNRVHRSQVEDGNRRKSREYLSDSSQLPKELKNLSM